MHYLRVEEIEEHKKQAIGSNFVYLKKRGESGK
jgi:TfoX/Sxy family transcriptional regulator of competence genes